MARGAMNVESRVAAFKIVERKRVCGRGSGHG